MLTVFNAGNGDSILIRCPIGDILVDTGPARVKHGPNLIGRDLTVMLSHSHSDHIGGLPSVIRKNRVQKILIPYYLPEIIAISSFIKRIFKTSTKSLNWKMINNIGGRLLCDGDTIAPCIEVFNPPRDANDFHFFGEHSDFTIQKALAVLRQNDFVLDFDGIENYETPIVAESFEANHGKYQENARRLVHRFFITLANTLRGNSWEKKKFLFGRHFNLTANQASIVMKLSCMNETVLFTGDADENVFQRLISMNKKIQARILKIPHHGSRENMSLSILSRINPEIAIISHNNRKHGNSLDTHPHLETINMLDLLNIETFYTNPVIKKRVTIKDGSNGKTYRGIIEFT